MKDFLGVLLFGMLISFIIGAAIMSDFLKGKSVDSFEVEVTQPVKYKCTEIK